MFEACLLDTCDNIAIDKSVSFERPEVCAPGLKKTKQQTRSISSSEFQKYALQYYLLSSIERLYDDLTETGLCCIVVLHIKILGCCLSRLACQHNITHT